MGRSTWRFLIKCCWCAGISEWTDTKGPRPEFGYEFAPEEGRRERFDRVQGGATAATMVRHYRPDPVDRETLERIVVTVRHASSAGYSQGQLLLVVSEPEVARSPASARG